MLSMKLKPRSKAIQQKQLKPKKDVKITRIISSIHDKTVLIKIGMTAKEVKKSLMTISRKVKVIQITSK